MALLQRLLLFPLLAPLLLVLLVAALNPRPNLALRLLIWTSPALPIGAWIALAAGGGAGLSAAGAALALRSPATSLRRQVRRATAGGSRAAAQPQPQAWAPPPAASGPAAGPARPPGDPAPTVAVPFRVIRKGRRPEAQAEPAPPQATAVGDGWDSAPSDDW